MIVFDTETTGLDKPAATPLDEQPEIIELGVIILDDRTLVEDAAFSTLVRPKKLPLPAKITEITGLTDKDLKDKKPFSAHVKDLAEFFCGQRVMVGHNLSYDVKMLTFELTRLGFMNRFPWPFTHVCTIEQTKHMFHKFPKQDELYAYYMGRPPKGAHRALNDVRNLAECIRHMRKENLL